MITWLAIAALAAPTPALLVVSSPVYWQEGGDCGEARCAAPDLALRHVEADAFRAAWLLGAGVAAEHTVVLSPDDGALPWRVAPSEAATHEAVLAAIAHLGEAGPLDLVVVLSAHGTEAEVHLADAPVQTSELRARLVAAAGEGGRVTLIADSCHSSRWRGDLAVGTESRFPDLRQSRDRMIEFVVRGPTPEDDGLGGGLFGYTILSGLIGSADLDGDGVVEAQELSDHVHAYASGADFAFQPVVRVPRPGQVTRLPDLRVDGGVVLPAAESARWVVRLVDGPIVAEVLVDARPVPVALPPGSYVVTAVPVASLTGSYKFKVNRGEAHAVEVGPGWVELTGAGDVVELGGVARGKGAAGMEGLAVRSVAVQPVSDERYLRSRRGLLSLGGAAGTSQLAGAPAWGGGAARWTGGWPSGPTHLWVRGRYGRSADRSESAVGAGIDLSHTRDHVSVGALLGAGGAGFVVPSGPEAGSGTVGVEATLGGRLTWLPGRVGVELVGAWTPAWSWVSVPDASDMLARNVVPTAAARRWGADLALVWRL
ncbi:MAG: hypothetical protein ACI9K2_007617 [Myxococcota bacterium]